MTNVKEMDREESRAALLVSGQVSLRLCLFILIREFPAIAGE